MTNDPPAVRVRDLCVDRGGRRVLDRIALDVPAGALTALAGPSGCGKTTLMRAIVGVQIVASGEVTVLGAPAGTPALRRRVGYVTQAASVYDDLTVAENLAYFRVVAGAGRDAPAAVLATVGLTRLAGQVVRTLSGGERARVSLAVALLGDPDLLVLDEPTVGLDPVLREELWGAFRRLAASGRALLVSTHVMEEATECDRLVLLREGRVLADTTPGDLLRATGTSDLTAAFLATVRREPERVTA
jgi:ABC-2 type transport system ATP-binding protein